MKKILAVIPARGGSKGIPRKNVKDLAGKPMIAYIIETTLRVSLVDRVVVSTDDQEIADVAQKYGAEVPFLRPAELATDEVPTLPVLQHVVQELKLRDGYEPDYVLLVYPTSPLLRAERIEEAITLALAQDSDGVASGYYDKGHYWQKGESGWARLYPKTLENRQKTTPLFKENGAIYLAKTSVLQTQLLPEHIDLLIMDPEENIDVDEMADFVAVEKILTQTN